MRDSPNPSHLSDPNLVLQFQFLRIDPQFAMLQSNEKLVAKQEFLSALEPLVRNLPLMETYALGGLTANGDILLWRAATDLEILEDSFDRLRSLGAGKYLSPIQSYLTLPTQGMRLEGPRSKYLFIHAVAFKDSWLSLTNAQQQELTAEEGKLLVKYPVVRFSTLEPFGPTQQKVLRIFETEDPARFKDLSKELRRLKISAHFSSNSAFWPCVRKDIRDVVELLG